MGDLLVLADRYSGRLTVAFVLLVGLGALYIFAKHLYIERNKCLEERLNLEKEVGGIKQRVGFLEGQQESRTEWSRAIEKVHTKMLEKIVEQSTKK